jgi:hypothetical protein
MITARQKYLKSIVTPLKVFIMAQLLQGDLQLLILYARFKVKSVAFS